MNDVEEPALREEPCHRCEMGQEPRRKFIRSYEDLDVFQRAMSLLKPVHAAALELPKYEQYDLANQMRRACKSIPANIAEGYGRKRSAKEFQMFLSTALGSATELEVHLKVARTLEYIEAPLADHLIAECEVIGKMLFRLIQHWRSIESSLPSSHRSEPSS